MKDNENTIGIPDEEVNEIYAEMAAYDQEQKDKWEEAKKELEGLIHPKYFDYIENHDSYGHEGIVEMYETDEKQGGYPKSQRNCRVADKDDNMLYMFTKGEVEYFYGKTGKYEGEIIEYWVWQTTGYACDDYSGYQLFALNDGRYWKVRYSC